MVNQPSERGMQRRMIVVFRPQDPDKTPVTRDPQSWPMLLKLAIHDASDDLEELRCFSSTNCGIRIALNPKTVPMDNDAMPLTTNAVKYCK